MLPLPTAELHIFSGIEEREEIGTLWQASQLDCTA